MKTVKDFMLITICIIAAGSAAGGLATLFILGIAVIVGLILKLDPVWPNVVNGAVTCGIIVAVGLICCYIIVWYDNSRHAWDDVYRLKNSKLFRKYAFQRLVGRIAIARKKKELLSRHGWYRNIKGGYAHPHAMDYMSIWEIHRYTPEQLEYKLKHGSMAELPQELK